LVVIFVFTGYVYSQGADGCTGLATCYQCIGEAKCAWCSDEVSLLTLVCLYICCSYGEPEGNSF